MGYTGNSTQSMIRPRRCKWAQEERNETLGPPETFDVERKRSERYDPRRLSPAVSLGPSDHLLSKKQNKTSQSFGRGDTRRPRTAEGLRAPVKGVGSYRKTGKERTRRRYGNGTRIRT